MTILHKLVNLILSGCNWVSVYRVINVCDILSRPVALRLPVLGLRGSLLVLVLLRVLVLILTRLILFVLVELALQNVGGARGSLVWRRLHEIVGLRFVVWLTLRSLAFFKKTTVCRQRFMFWSVQGGAERAWGFIEFALDASNIRSWIAIWQPIYLFESIDTIIAVLRWN